MATYDSVNNQGRSPYGSGDPYYNESTGFITPAKPAKQGASPWVKFGVPVAILVIIGAVVGGVLGSRASSNNNSSSSSNGGAGTASGEAAASSAASAKAQIGIFPTATNSQYMKPLYPSTVSGPANVFRCHLD